MKQLPRKEPRYLGRDRFVGDLKNSSRAENKANDYFDLKMEDNEQGRVETRREWEPYDENATIHMKNQEMINQHMEDRMNKMYEH